MYTMYNPSAMWPQQQVPVPGQVLYAPAAYIVNGAPPAMPMGQGQAIFYPPQAQGWYPASQRSSSTASDDDVFLRDAHMSGPSVYKPVAVPAKKTKVVECQTDESYFKRHAGVQKKTSTGQNRTRRKLSTESLPDGSSPPESDNSLSNSNSSSRSTSPQQKREGESSLDATRPPFVPRSRASARQTRLNNDLTLYDVFSASLCSAINADPPNDCPYPANTTPPLQKTSSPIREEDGTSQTSSLIKIDQSNNHKSRSRFLTSVASERCMRFSQNGWEVELDSERASGAQKQNGSLSSEDPVSIRREDFLKVLEMEREKQKKCVLPRYAPKMNCKFCKNNGEAPEVYTKHRLHFNEKTVCPLLRHYVCRLCNSTGDFAHTIKHCPFNNKYDALAWKATFL